MMSGTDATNMDTMGNCTTPDKLVQQEVVSIRPALKQTYTENFGGVCCGDLSIERSVRFSLVEVREYPVVLGDHPDCSSGPPLTLGWNVTNVSLFDVDTYEDNHPRRKLSQMVMDYYKRVNILLACAGYSRAELDSAIKEVERVKKMRARTRMMIPYQKLEEAVQSTGRKIRRGTFKRSTNTTTNLVALHADI